MWNNIYVEKDIQYHSRTQSILNKFKKAPIIVEKYDQIWGRSKRPYLHKRDGLNLFIAQKKGPLLKRAPEAYGTQGDPHYYYIHAYNCVYECEYCYLQGYFSTPDIVLFINHEDILEKMKEILQQHPHQKVWFHAGEFSDSLALSHLSGEIQIYHNFLTHHENALIELRTKSVNIREVIALNPLKNFITSFSLSPHQMGKKIDLKTPSISSRLQAMKKLNDSGHKIAAHFDPIIYQDHFLDEFENLLSDMKHLDLLDSLEYVSLGVVRFTKDVYREVERNYPLSFLHTGPMIKSFDNKIRYPKPLRLWILKSIKELCLKFGLAEEKIYLCMEDDS